MTAPAAHTRQVGAPSPGRGRPRGISGSATREHVGRSRPARFLPAWPAEMRADVAAAYFDFSTTGQLFKAVARGEAPRPTATRLREGKREPVWALDVCRNHIAARHNIPHDAQPNGESIGDLV